ncbi:MAG: acyltransferase [Treponema sp.]|jgi:peptidoglycan/LPS O-acetylase OafA/YrhL|nr:acyltransferase [Treponema sp.]
MMQENRERMIGFDALRFFMVLMVVILHASMTFMEYAPLYWYVLDEDKSIAFTLLAMLLDSFPMTVLFFLSGYFARPSFEKRGFRSFMANKVKRIGVPWVLGVLTVAPFFAHLTYKAFGFPEVPPWEFFTKYFWGAFYQQAHYWFLGALFFLFLFYALYAHIAKRVAAREESDVSGFTIIISVWIISTVAYYLSTLVKFAEEWVNIGYVLFFQQARIAGYIMAFLMGIYAYKKRWYTKEGWTPKWAFWGIIETINAAVFFIWHIMVKWMIDEHISLIINSIIYNAMAIISTIFLTGLFVRFERALGKMTAWISECSYVMYWFHIMALEGVLYLIKGYKTPGVIKWLFSILFTVIICQLLGKYVIKKIRLKPRKAMEEAR